MRRRQADVVDAGLPADEVAEGRGHLQAAVGGAVFDDDDLAVGAWSSALWIAWATKRSAL